MPDQQAGATRQAGNSNKRALVLAGGGAAGNAWELGLIAGLSDAGVDVTEADVIIGTSAGSTVAAQITSGTRPAELYAAILAEVPQPQAGDAGSDRGRAPNFSGPAYMEWSTGIIGSAEDASDMRRRMGAAALEMDDSDGSSQTRWRDIVAARLPSQHWPQQLYLSGLLMRVPGRARSSSARRQIESILVDTVAAGASNSFVSLPSLPASATTVRQQQLQTSGELADLTTRYQALLVPHRSAAAGAGCRWSRASMCSAK